MNRLFLLALCTFPLVAQVTVSMRNQSLSADANSAVQAWMNGQFSGVSAKLTVAIDDKATTINVDSTNRIGANNLIRIEDEVLQISAKTATTLTVTRGANGTAATSHAVGLAVQELKFRNISQLFDFHLKEVVKQIMEISPVGAVAQQKAAIATAEAAIAAAKESSVQ